MTNDDGQETCSSPLALLELAHHSKQSEPLPCAQRQSLARPTACTRNLGQGVHWGKTRVYFIPRLTSLSPELKASIWYQSNEYDAIKRENSKVIARLIESDTTIEESNHCTSRGLDRMTPTEISRRQHLRSEARDAVLDEQDLQFFRRDHQLQQISPQSKMEHSDRLARIYSHITRNATYTASRIGLTDELEAALVWSSTTTTTTCTRPQKSQRKTVRFFPSVLAEQGLHIDEYTAEERQNSRHKPVRFGNFMKQNKETVKYAKSEEDDVEHEHERDVCLRGLETLLEACHSYNVSSIKAAMRTTARRSNIAFTWNAVLDEQDRQDGMARFSHDELGHVSRESSSHCTIAAHKTALQDEQFVAVSFSDECIRWSVAIP